MDVDQGLRRAIEEKRLIAFVLGGHERIGEPHDYGIVGREERLFFYQTSGTSRSGRPLGWRWAVVASMSSLRLLDERFAGPRPVPSGRHQRWDRLIASVSHPPGPVAATRS